LTVTKNKFKYKTQHPTIALNKIEKKKAYDNFSSAVSVFLKYFYVE